MARTRWPSDLATPASCPGQADQTGSAGGCQKTWGPADRSSRRTARAASAESEVRPGPRPPTLRPHHRKTTEAGPEALSTLSLPSMRLSTGWYPTLRRRADCLFGALLGLIGSSRVRWCQACADGSALACGALGEDPAGEAGGCRRDGRAGGSEPGGASTSAAPGYVITWASAAPPATCCSEDRWRCDHGLSAHRPACSAVRGDCACGGPAEAAPAGLRPAATPCPRPRRALDRPGGHCRHPRPGGPGTALV